CEDHPGRAGKGREAHAPCDFPQRWRQQLSRPGLAGWLALDELLLEPRGKDFNLHGEDKARATLSVGAVGMSASRTAFLSVLLLGTISPAWSASSGDVAPVPSSGEVVKIASVVKTISHQSTLYHGWPTVAAGRGSTLFLVYSGGRDYHVCPFGRVDMM